MPATHRRSDLVVIQRLMDEPHRFQLLQAVTILQGWLQKLGVKTEKAGMSYLRFRNSTSMSYPPSEIEDLSIEADAEVTTAADLLLVLIKRQLNHITITPASAGYLGVNGVLPSHYTDQVARSERTSQHNAGRAFLDILATRTFTMLLEACTKYRIEHMRDVEGNDSFLPLLLMLGGGTDRANCGSQDGVTTEALANYAGIFQQRTVNADTLTRILSDYFQAPITVTPNVESYDKLEPHEQTVLGVSAILGGGAMLGCGRWVRDKAVGIRIGPVRKTAYRSLMPDQPASKALHQLLSRFAVAPMQFQIEVLMDPQDCVPLRLGDPEPGQLGLGIDIVLGTPQPGEMPSCRYTLELPAANQES